ncbi:hypothetical protein AQF98_11535 [Pedobacter sp. Hv1]|nr:hypothetical protein AQF98_11535 [Pedobacter sp. Hv1]
MFALAGLIIPVIIHLWNVKRGKTLKIGSIALMGESAKASSKSWHIKDWPLFILRCLLLVLIAFLLAQPYLKKTTAAKNRTGWVLLEKDQLKQLDPTQKQTIDSLLNLGFELHEFNLGFKQLTWKDTAITTDKRQLSYTSLFKQLNSQLPTHFPVYLFANHQLHNFDGDLPAIAFDLKWKTPISTDTLKNWISSFAGKNYQAQSSASLTSYKAVDGETSISLIDVLIYDPSGADRKYIEAALQAISDFTKRKINIKIWDENVKVQANVGFWLSDQAIDQKYLSKLKTGANLFTYAKGKTKVATTLLNLGSGAWGNYPTVQLYQSIIPVQLKGETIWSDGFGQAILSKETNENYHTYRFYTRFNPQWTDLVWSEQFVKALMPIMYADQDAIDFGFENNALDQRQLAQGQKELIQLNLSAVAEKSSISKPLQQLFWLLAFLVLIIERILSFRKQRKLNHV